MKSDERYKGYTLTEKFGKDRYIEVSRNETYVFKAASIWAAQNAIDTLECLPEHEQRDDKKPFRGSRHYGGYKGNQTRRW